MKLILLALLLSLTAHAQSDFDGCPATGDNAHAKVQAADELKNRDAIPEKYTTKDFSEMLAMKVTDPASQDQAIKLTGFILDIRDGGKESCNCHSDVHKDTHIYLVKDASVTDAGDAIIVEVTPRMRAALGTTAELKEKYLHKNVEVYGYLFCDAEHKANSTADDGKGLLWRGTVWECHPVTKIGVVE